MSSSFISKSSSDRHAWLFPENHSLDSFDMVYGGGAADSSSGESGPVKEVRRVEGKSGGRKEMIVRRLRKIFVIAA